VRCRSWQLPPAERRKDVAHVGEVEKRPFDIVAEHKTGQSGGAKKATTIGRACALKGITAEVIELIRIYKNVFV